METIFCAVPPFPKIVKRPQNGGGMKKNRGGAHGPSAIVRRILLLRCRFSVPFFVKLLNILELFLAGPVEIPGIPYIWFDVFLCPRCILKKRPLTEKTEKTS